MEKGFLFKLLIMPSRFDHHPRLIPICRRRRLEYLSEPPRPFNGGTNPEISKQRTPTLCCEFGAEN